ncbi:B12-binding domain-containing radical SAM protein [Candidatus Sumerlaeota bacterium]|nr:B12-binding domain-containing radical SAM protein [Candidatus Sumerlaeota bacterium]
MSRVLLVSLYDEFCRGPRQLLSELLQSGHDAWLLVFKLHRRKELGSDEPSAPEWQIEIQAGGGRAVLPYPFAPTDKEVGLACELMQRLRPDLVGLSVYSPQVRQAADFTRLVRQILPGVPVLWGGPHATCLPDSCLEYADYAMVGEGDTALVDLASRVGAGVSVDSVASLVWRDASGQIKRNPLAPVIDDLDSLPFPWHRYERLFYIDDDTLYENRVPENSLYARNYRIMTSRGCPFDCSYCMLSYQKEIMPECSHVRMRSVENVIAELEEEKARRGVPFFVEIEDDVFTINYNRMKAFLDLYSERIAMPYWCYTHPRYAKPEMLNLLRSHRCSFVVMGIQSGSDRIAKEIFNRHIGNAGVLEAATNIHASGLRPFYDLISNNPFETDEDRISTFHLLRSLPKPYELQLAVLNFYPNLRITRMRDEQHLPEVDHFAYRYWNSLYQLASTTEISDEMAQHLLADEGLKHAPEMLEWMAKQTYQAVRHGADEHAENISLREDIDAGIRREEALRILLHDLHMRKGFRHFIRLSDLYIRLTKKHNA